MEEPLSADKLFSACDLSAWDFQSSDELEKIELGLGQERALEAIGFALAMPHNGYHLYVSGPQGVGKSQLVEGLIKRQLSHESAPDDWCYVNNFQQSNKPILLRLPAGKGKQLQKAMLKLIEDLLDAIPETFKGEGYQNALREINDELQVTEESLFEALAEEAKKEDILLLPTPKGYTMGPSHDGQIYGPEEFNRLSAQEQEAIKVTVEKYNVKLKDILEKLPQLKADAHQKVKDLNTWFTVFSVQPFFDRLKENWQEQPRVLDYLEAARENIVDNIGVFLRPDQDNTNIANNKFVHEPEYIPYHVNILVDNEGHNHAPIVVEDNPSHSNLFGQIEYFNYQNSMITNFTLMQAGSLHRANGGYLILDARKILSKPFVWDTLKRVLACNEAGIEKVDHLYNFSSGVSLKPEQMPLNIKVILIGDAYIQHVLKAYDPEFSALFKITADMSETINRSENNTWEYAKLIAGKIQEYDLEPFTRKAMEQLIEFSARYQGDSEKLSLNLEAIADLMREANYYAQQGEPAKPQVDGECVARALKQREFRYSKYAEHFKESIVRGDLLFNSEGTQVGEANALSVVQLGDTYVGRPTRISATARLGSGAVIDIERESDMAGPIHSKGVMILSAFLANRYAKDIPFALNATLVFEQSYGFVDGDSASAIELCTLLSAIADIPIKQNFAVTGSVDQNGRIQTIGAVNEKIEGFFDACAALGEVKGRAVIIPKANVKHLMLKRSVVEAVEAGDFSIYAVDQIDQMLELLTGMEAGLRNEDGDFPSGSFNGRVQASIINLSKKLFEHKAVQR